MIQRYKVLWDDCEESEDGDYCKYSYVEQLEKDHAEELTIATLLGYDKAKDKIEKLEKQNKQLLDALIIAYKELDALWDVLYGKNLEVKNWHLNGDTERMDRFFEENSYDALLTLKPLIESITGKKPEDYNV